ncbi:hypothetical protein [Leucothrix arctica]|uniref:JmjC domain-containing protein n=1 Tax=Leucothrix arctica TaxID=1481894 RepID=A0A317C9H8_9GAMM|nr:hypothetical protein [Leucothrix arctica]PWQ95188.1 hypothetical protein DKT75_12625 [Leucothrix arctica]
MSTQYSDCIAWTQEEHQNFGVKPQISQHKFHELDLFSDEALVTLLDNYPREWLQCYTMGTNPENHNEWTPVHIAESSGRQILSALQKGRMWVNVINIDRYNGEYAELIEQMYQVINAGSDHITNAKSSFSALLISSPGIQVYCHVDADANMLWHLKGRKRVWVYPARDTRFAPQTYVEEIIGESRHENVPFERWYDDHAFSHELKAGEVVSWPQHSPHRVENIGFNVSLTTSYGSKESRRQLGVHGFNHYILKPLGFKNRSIERVGLVAEVKSFTYFVLKKLKVLKRGERTASYTTDLQLDDSHPEGMSKRDEASLPEFAKA